MKVGIDVSLTGAMRRTPRRIANGAMLAFEEANEKGAIPGVTFELVTLDDGTATAGQYDPAQAATNARKMVSDKEVVAAIGPQMSGAGKAMAPILSQGDLATITPSSTNPDITDPKFADQYRPAGKPIYFRTVTTDAYQGPNMANFLAETLKVKSVYVLDDSGAYGVGHGRRVPGAGGEEGHEGARPRPAGPEGGRLHGDADQDQVAQSGRDLLWRRRPGGREAGQAGLRHHSEDDQSRRRRHVQRRTCSPARASRRSRAGTRRSPRRMSTGGHRRRRSSSTPIRRNSTSAPDDYRSPPTTRRWSSSTRSSAWRQAASR